VIVSLFIDGAGKYGVAHTCGLHSNHNIRVVLLVVEVDDAEGAPAELSTVDEVLLVVEYQRVERLREGVLVLLLRKGGGLLFLLVYVLTDIIVVVRIFIVWVREIYLTLLLFFVFLFFND
jgi:hypothetical protein